ncbi:MAG: tRNA (adenosine(37)-N6)-threonylcarbamoyltransferase complex transferase subunit TsaD [candidate division Zixibacteria bacterium RBG_16_53_22]|nr:MAG: tRNA (adenosine(37)-N6)-threonylcarbamoyltransferase complex transferase subunit TsaD [candidate division Zixibacteria bacterium RBG_16_53_22]
MLVLGVETSCDETAAGVVRNGREILSNIILSQEIHARYGGVVPEIASRIHITELVGIIEKALSQAGVALDDLDGMAVTSGPGLVGCLLVGLSFVKSVHLAMGIPYYGVNHLEGHLFAGRLEHAPLQVPHVALVASGGHSNLYLVEDWGKYRLLGSTRDDAPGEAFDKVAKLLGLGYPGGPAIEKAAEVGDRKFIKFPRAQMGKDSYEFSFSGLKTAVSVYLQDKSPDFIADQRGDLAASFQEAIADVLVRKTLAAAENFGMVQVSITGGVARNRRLRELFDERKPIGARVFFPSPALCTDNGAMIAACGDFHLARGERSGLELNAVPYLEL